MTKTKQDNDVIDHIGLVYTKKNIELSRPIWPAVVYEENQTRQWCDQLYMCHLHQNQNLTIGTYEPVHMLPKPEKTMTWPIVKVWFTPKKKLSYHDQSDWVQPVMIIRQDNDVTDCIGLVCSKTESKLLGFIWLGIVYDENQTGQQLDWSYRYGLRRKWNWLIVINRIGCNLWKKPYKTTTWSIVQE